MSHSSGTVYTEDRSTIIGYFEYNGTVDVACSSVQKTADDVWKHWRTPESMRQCTCGQPILQLVVLDADYGGGIEWESVMCTTCMVIVDKFDPWPVDYD